MALTSLIDNSSNKKMNKKPKAIKNIDIEDLIENNLNTSQMTAIDELAENINHFGLYKPLEVYDLEDDTYMLIGGHRRLAALKKLYEEGRLDNTEVPCIIYPRPEQTEGDVEERMKIILSNAQRDLSNTDKVNLTKELLDCLELMPELKQPGELTRDWIAPFLGCKGVTAQKYINAAKGKENEKKEDKEEKEVTQNDLEKMLTQHKEKLNKLYWDIPSEVKDKVVGHTENKDITVDMMINKIVSATSLLLESLQKLE